MIPFSFMISLWKLLIRRTRQFGPDKLDLQDLCRGVLYILLTTKCKLCASWFSEGIFKSISH